MERALLAASGSKFQSVRTWVMGSPATLFCSVSLIRRRMNPSAGWLHNSSRVHCKRKSISIRVNKRKSMLFPILHQSKLFEWIVAWFELEIKRAFQFDNTPVTPPRMWGAIKKVEDCDSIITQRESTIAICCLQLLYSSSYAQKRVLRNSYKNEVFKKNEENRFWVITRVYIPNLASLALKIVELCSKDCISIWILIDNKKEKLSITWKKTYLRDE